MGTVLQGNGSDGTLSGLTGESGSRLALSSEMDGEHDDQAAVDNENDSPLPGLEGDEHDNGSGNGDEHDHDSPFVFDMQERDQPDGSPRQEGLIKFHDDEAAREGMPSIFSHFTLSDSLQSVRACVAADGACAAQASVVFRDGEIERVRLFDELILGEEYGEHEEDTGAHAPGH